MDEETGALHRTGGKVLVTMTGRHLNAVRSTSAGRLFDGVSAILGIRKNPLSREKHLRH